MPGPLPIVPSSFEVPVRVEADSFELVPLTMRGFAADYECYMSSVEHLQRTLVVEHPTRRQGPRWPEGTTPERALIDAAFCQMSFETFRSGFTYCAMDVHERRQLGCGYIFPSHAHGFQVECHTWVRADQLAHGFDERFYDWFRAWVEDVWPFPKDEIAWPGRAIPVEEWLALPGPARDLEAN
jgi:hypothetical protein